MTAKVPDQSTNLQATDLLAFDLLNKPLVQIELLLPLNLVVHHRPGRGELVVMDGDALRRLLLQINRSTNRDAIHLNEQSLLFGPALCLSSLHHHMESGAKQ